MATTYGVYTATGETLLGNTVITSVGNSPTATGTITDPGGGSDDTHILGDVLNDQFTFQSASYTYIGTISVIQGGQSVPAIVAQINSNFYVFVPNAGTGLSLSLGTVNNQVWNLDSNAPGCLLEGTLIKTPHGERRVEDLRAGDVVVTADGATAPIRWIGHTRINRYQPDPLTILPIRIRAGALGDHLPRRDLLVSPDHAVLIDGTLIQAGALVNGESVLREWTAPDSFNYYHVELEAHSLILAEGAPVETFVDNVDRMSFDNWEEHLQQFGETASIVEMDYPRAKSARQVPSHVRRIIDRERPKFASATAA